MRWIKKDTHKENTLLESINERTDKKKKCHTAINNKYKREGKKTVYCFFFS